MIPLQSSNGSYRCQPIRVVVEHPSSEGASAVSAAVQQMPLLSSSEGVPMVDGEDEQSSIGTTSVGNAGSSGDVVQVEHCKTLVSRNFFLKKNKCSFSLVF